MGPGSTLARVTIRFEYIPGETNSAVINLMQYIVNDVEYERFITTFKFWRLEGIKIILPPRMVNSGAYTTTGRIGIDWNNNVLEDILGDDSSKEVTNYQTRNVVYKFKPPNARLLCENGTPINYREWQATNIDLGSTVPPGYIKVTCNWSFAFVVEALVKFRGNQTNMSATYKVQGNTVTKLDANVPEDIMLEQDIQEEPKEVKKNIKIKKK